MAGAFGLSRPPAAEDFTTNAQRRKERGRQYCEGQQPDGMAPRRALAGADFLERSVCLD